MNLIKLLLILVMLSATNIVYSKTSIAVIDLRSVGLEEEFSVLLTDALRSELFKYEKFEVMNRENMQEIMGEQVFQASGVCDDNACYVEMGKVLAVEKIVTGSIGKLGNTYSLTIKMIDIETSKNDDSITERKKCSEDDLFIMIENTVKRLAGLKEEKIATPTALKEIKEIKTQRSTPEDGFTVRNDDIKEWEMLGISKEKYIDYKRSGITIEQWNVLNKEIQSPSSNAIKSLIFSGRGQSKINNPNYKFHYTMGSIFTVGTVISGLILLSYSDNGSDDENDEVKINDAKLGILSFGSLFFAFNIYSSIDAYKATTLYNESLKQKYKLTITPAFNPKNNGVGIGFVVNF